MRFPLKLLALSVWYDDDVDDFGWESDGEGGGIEEVGPGGADGIEGAVGSISSKTPGAQKTLLALFARASR